MKAPAPADLQRWSEDVARDAASLSFLPLARAYRRQGRRDAALRLCLRGLEHHPDNVEAHSLLAMLYFESGHRVKAYDEWSMVLTLEPDNFDALRGMGFYYLEQEDHQVAKRHLERAAALKASDPAVQEALRIIRERLGEAAPEPETPSIEDFAEPWADAAATGPVSTPVPPAPAPEAFPTPAPTPAPAPGFVEANYSDPARIFDSILKGDQVLGALILDSQGLVMGGSLSGEVGQQAETLGAILGGAIDEAMRTTEHLSLGSWKGVVLEADQAVLHFSPVRDGIVLLAARKTAPMGWVLRSAQQASVIADRFLELYS